MTLEIIDKIYKDADKEIINIHYDKKNLLTKAKKLKREYLVNYLREHKRIDFNDFLVISKFLKVMEETKPKDKIETKQTKLIENGKKIQKTKPNN